MPGAGRDIGEHEIGAGEHTQGAEMMLADPRRMKPDIFGINRLVDNVGDKPVRGSAVVRIAIVAEREIAEFHWALPAAEDAPGFGRKREPR